MTPLYKRSVIMILLLVFRFITFSFQVFLPFDPEMSTSFTSYMVYVIYSVVVWVP
jgi:hypothetical protein